MNPLLRSIILIAIDNAAPVLAAAEVGNIVARVRGRFAALDHDQAAAQAHASAYARLRQRLYADFKERSL